MKMISTAHMLSGDGNARYKLGLYHLLSSPHAKTNMSVCQANEMYQLSMSYVKVRDIVR